MNDVKNAKRIVACTTKILNVLESNKLNDEELNAVIEMVRTSLSVEMPSTESTLEVTEIGDEVLTDEDASAKEE